MTERHEIEADMFFQLNRVMQENELDDPEFRMNMIVNLYLELNKMERLEVLDIQSELINME